MKQNQLVNCVQNKTFYFRNRKPLRLIMYEFQTKLSRYIHEHSGKLQNIRE